MRCQVCDRRLSSYESTRKNKWTGEYLDCCNRCSGIVEDAMTHSETFEEKEFERLAQEVKIEET